MREPGEIIKSPRGNPLVCQDSQGCRTLTVENEQKWYEFYVLEEDNKTVTEVPNSIINMALNEGLRYVDHTPHPLFFKRIAELMMVSVDFNSLDMVAGRWVLEQDPNYEDVGYV